MKPFDLTKPPHKRLLHSVKPTAHGEGNPSSREVPTSSQCKRMSVADHQGSGNLGTEELVGVLTDKLPIALAQRFSDNGIISEILLGVLNQASLVMP